MKLADDDFRAIVNGLPKGVLFTMVSDCCHSGGLIDGLPQQIGPTDQVLQQAQQAAQAEAAKAASGTRDFNLADIPGLQGGGGGGGLFGSVFGAVVQGVNEYNRANREQEQEQQASAEELEPLPSGIKHREVKLDQLLQLLSQASGQKVDVGNIRASLFQMFGKDSSPMVQNFVGVIMQHGPELMQKIQSGESGAVFGALSSLAVDFVKGNSGDQQQQQQGWQLQQATAQAAPGTNPAPAPVPAAPASQQGPQVAVVSKTQNVRHYVFESMEKKTFRSVCPLHV